MACSSRVVLRSAQDRAWGWLIGAALALLAPAAGARAADIETRDFTVFVGARRCGEVHMTIHRQDNGLIQMRCDTDIKVSILLKSYKYSYRGLEVWKDGRLVRFDSNTDDDGKRFVVTAAAEEAGLRVSVNNVERMARPDVWLTSYWCLPVPKQRTGEAIPLIDADSGKDLTGKLNLVGAEQRKIAGNTVNVQHYRLTGGVVVDLWYDAGERLVRQEWMEQGHRTIMELNRVRR
jgi:hypothetical protein